MPEPSILYLVINLPQSGQRREAILEQASRFGITMQIVPAVDGSELDMKNSSQYGYDERARKRRHTNNLLPNEIACLLSHKRALQTFLDSAADYAVILEDDAVLAPHFMQGMDELLHHLSGWEVVKLFTDDGKLHPLIPTCEDAVVQPVFPRKLPWVAVGYLYSRRAAEVVKNGLKHYWRPADAQIGKILIDKHIPTIGVSPGMIHSSDPHNAHSVLDPAGERRERPIPRNLFQYLTYRAGVLLTGLGKSRMCRMMSRRLKRH